jgi:hypothetical protein
VNVAPGRLTATIKQAALMKMKRIADPQRAAEVPYMPVPAHDGRD